MRNKQRTTRRVLRVQLTRCEQAYVSAGFWPAIHYQRSVSLSSQQWSFKRKKKITESVFLTEWIRKTTTETLYTSLI